jgi:hypothetical protein
MICKACTKCRVYIIIQNGHYGELIEHRFDADHREHPVAIIPDEEVKQYRLVNAKYRKIIAARAFPL